MNRPLSPDFSRILADFFGRRDIVMDGSLWTDARDALMSARASVGLQKPTKPDSFRRFWAKMQNEANARGSGGGQMLEAHRTIVETGSGD
jgi:hypothetical protein